MSAFTATLCRYIDRAHGDRVQVPKVVLRDAVAVIHDQRAELERLRDVIGFIADWAHDCSPSNQTTPFTRQHPDEVDPRQYGFDDIEDRCRAALAPAPAKETPPKPQRSPSDYTYNSGHRRAEETP